MLKLALPVYDVSKTVGVSGFIPIGDGPGGVTMHPPPPMAEKPGYQNDHMGPYFKKNDVPMEKDGMHCA